MSEMNSDNHEAARLRSAIRALVRRFSVSERADVECCGLTVAQAATLEALQATPRMRLSDLGKRLGITPSTLTRNLARLEAEGLVNRIPDPEDGRGVQVALTATGHGAAEEVGRQGVDFAAEVLARQLSAQHDIFSRYFGGQINWSAVNFGFAPFLSGRTEAELADFTRELLTSSLSLRDRGASLEKIVRWL